MDDDCFLDAFFWRMCDQGLLWMLYAVLIIGFNKCFHNAVESFQICTDYVRMSSLVPDTSVIRFESLVRNALPCDWRSMFDSKFCRWSEHLLPNIWTQPHKVTEFSGYVFNISSIKLHLRQLGWSAVGGDRSSKWEWGWKVGVAPKRGNNMVSG